MEPYDLLMLIVLLGAGLWGYWKGMAWQIASVASLVLSYFSALNFSPSLLQILGWKEPWERFLAMFILYVASSFGIWFVFRQVRSAIDQVRMRDFDRQIGGIVGLAKGVLLCLAVTFFAVTLTAKSREMVLRSKSGRYMSLALHKSKGVMPRELDQVVGPYLRRLEHELNQAPINQTGSVNTGGTGWETPGSANQAGGGWGWEFGNGNNAANAGPNPTGYREQPPGNANSQFPSPWNASADPSQGNAPRAGETAPWGGANSWGQSPTPTSDRWGDPFAGPSNNRALPENYPGQPSPSGPVAPSPFEEIRSRLKAKLREKVDQTLNQAFDQEAPRK